jgi:hypothetical protein
MSKVSGIIPVREENRGSLFMNNLTQYVSSKMVFGNLFKVKKREESPSEEKSSLELTTHSMRLADFDAIRTLGSGSFGRVKFVKSKIDGQYYAIKYMKKHDIIKLKQGMSEPNSINNPHLS